VVLKNKILLIKKAQADMMNLQAVKTGRIIHDISVEKYVRIPYAKAIVRFLFLNCACLLSFKLKKWPFETRKRAKGRSTPACVWWR